MKPDRIWKFELQITDIQIVKMPRHAQLLTVQVQHGKPMLWAAVNQLDEKVGRIISIYGTGRNLDSVEALYVGTVQLMSGNAVFHVFDRGEVV